MKHIKIFSTGGTFDKEFNEITGKLFFKKTQLYELLEMGRSKLDIKIETLMMVDSLKMSNAERQYIVDKCKKEKTHKIIITHGTDTMVKTAELLAKQIKDKTIILTGAMIPIKFAQRPFCPAAAHLNFPPTLLTTRYFRDFSRLGPVVVIWECLGRD